MHRVQYVDYRPFATVCSRITRFLLNAQKGSLSTSQCKICISLLNILW